MPKTLIPVDVTKEPTDQPVPLHNRWHPEIPAIVSVKKGDTFRVECLDWTGGQIKDSDSAYDVKNLELTRVHYLSGPIAVEGTEPGDLLIVDILDIGMLPQSEWGFTGILARENGGGFLADFFSQAYKAIWNFEGIYATSRHIPGVRFAGLTHPGLIGIAPSKNMLKKWNTRETDLFNTNPTRVPALAALPEPANALLGAVPSAHRERIASEAARTVPPRENGGNCDIKNLSRGSRIYFPVNIQGANLSMGDIHFSQGDGEISCCGAIEMAGWIDLHVDIIKDGMNKYKITQPLFQPGPIEPRYSRFLVFEGISVDTQGKQYYLDPFIAYQRACLHAIEYLTNFGYTPEQAYVLLGAAPIEGRISSIVDIPNACCTVALPLDIFEFPIVPTEKGPYKVVHAPLARA